MKGWLVFLVALCIALTIALVAVAMEPFQIEHGSHHWYNTFVEHTPDWLVAIFTLALTGSTLLLWKAGEDQLVVTKVAADAATETAKAATAAERARFYVEVQHNFLNFVSGKNTFYAGSMAESPSSVEPAAKISFKNHGKTPGIVKEVGCCMMTAVTPPDPVYAVKVVEENMISAGGTTQVVEQRLHRQATIGLAAHVADGKTTLWLFGYLQYDDVFGGSQVHRFCQRFVRLNESQFALQSFDHKHYNVSS